MGRLAHETPQKRENMASLLTAFFYRSRLLGSGEVPKTLLLFLVHIDHGFRNSFPLSAHVGRGR